jgi:hypothetical protein
MVLNQNLEITAINANFANKVENGNTYRLYFTIKVKQFARDET